MSDRLWLRRLYVLPFSTAYILRTFFNACAILSQRQQNVHKYFSVKTFSGYIVALQDCKDILYDMIENRSSVCRIPLTGQTAACMIGKQIGSWYTYKLLYLADACERRLHWVLIQRGCGNSFHGMYSPF